MGPTVPKILDEIVQGFIHNLVVFWYYFSIVSECMLWVSSDRKSFVVGL